MPLKLKHKFEAEYGKKKGDRIFYAWENKHGMLKMKPGYHFVKEAKEYNIHKKKTVFR